MTSAEAAGPEIVCVGMSTVDVWVQGFTAAPSTGGVAFVDTIGMGVGGDALNQAITLSRLGHPTALLSVVGRDNAGQLVRRLTSAAGVDVTRIQTSGMGAANPVAPNTTLASRAKNRRTEIGLNWSGQ